jgi:HlyD family secretion protein
LPAGVVKAEGRTEATEVDVSSKYPGQLAEISVDEGSKVILGQVIARVSSPEFEAQLRAAQSDLQSAKHASAAAEADIASRQAALEFAKSDFERGQELMKTPRSDTASILEATTKAPCCGASPYADPEHQFPSQYVFDALSQPGHSLELRNPGIWPDRPILLASQFHGWLETDSAYRNICGVWHPNH